MTRTVFNLAFVIGSVVVIWMGANFVDSDLLALSMIALIGVVYVFGAWELVKFRQATQSLSKALASAKQPVVDLSAWLSSFDASLHNAVRGRIEGEKTGLPGPVLTPYLVGLLVMLGLLGTFAGMVGTLKGAVFALQSTTELQAIREGLAAPMKGLGMAFGTSVAGVAASAILGLMSTLSRKERMSVTRLLDSKIHSVFSEFSLSHHRLEAYKATQSQVHLLPDVADKLQQVAEQMLKTGEHISSQLVESQAAMNQSAQVLFSDLAKSVESSLKESLSDSGRLAGESIQPVVAEAMEAISLNMAEQVSTTQESLSRMANEQLEQVSKTVSDSAKSLQEGVAQQRERWIETTQQNDRKRLEQWAETFETLQQQAQAESEEQAQRTIKTLEQTSVSQQASMNSLTKELEQVLQGLQKSAQDIVKDNAQTTHQLMSDSQRLVKESETLIETRMANEQAWLAGQNERINVIADHLKEQLSALREEESGRAEAALSRLSDLEGKVAEHLSALGLSLEEPMARLIETASETPKAAAEVIGHLRREISNNIERDNNLLAERQEIMSNVNTLFSTMEESAAGQRQAIDQLVQTSSDTLSNVGSQFNQSIEEELSKLTQISDHFAGSSVEIASLGEAFTVAVKLFSESNAQLMESLTRIESALEHSASRSDEQLGYYVAQAREIIDHSMLSQKELFEELKQLGKNQRTLDAAL